MPTWEHAKTPFIQLQSFERENEKGEASHDDHDQKEKKEQKRNGNYSLAATKAARPAPAVAFPLPSVKIKRSQPRVNF